MNQPTYRLIFFKEFFVTSITFYICHSTYLSKHSDFSDFLQFFLSFSFSQQRERDICCFLLLGDFRGSDVNPSIDSTATTIRYRTETFVFGVVSGI